MREAAWPVTELENLASEITVGFVGSMASEYVKDGIPFLRSMNVEPFRVNGKDLRYISPAFHEKLRKSALGPGDVVIVRTGKPGTCAVIPEELGDANCSDLVIVRCGEHLDPKFLAYYVNSAASHHVLAHLVGAVQQHFNIGSAKKMLVPEIDEEEQLAVTEILSSLDEKIELNRKQNRTLEAIAQTLFKRWFVEFEFPDENGRPYKTSGGAMQPTDKSAGEPIWTAESRPEGVSAMDGANQLGEIPVGWEVVKVGDVVEILGGGTPSTKSEEYWTNGQIDWYSPTDLTKSGALFSSGSGKKITEQGLANSSAKLFPAYSLMMTSRATIGVISINGTTACTNQGFMTLIPNEDFPLYLLHGWLLQQLPEIHSKASGSTFKEISRGTFKDFDILKSPVVEKYQELVEPIYRKIESNLRESELLVKARDTLLPKLISGELRIPDSMTAEHKTTASEQTGAIHDQ